MRIHIWWPRTDEEFWFKQLGRKIPLRFGEKIIEAKFTDAEMSIYSSGMSIGLEIDDKEFQNFVTGKVELWKGEISGEGKEEDDQSGSG